MIAITREPSGSFESCELSYIDREPIDAVRAREQHRAYRDALAELGVTVRHLPELEGYPDAVFVEDTALVLDEVAVLLRPGAESRRGEVESVAAALGEHRELLRIEAPGTLDGGDIVRVESTLYVGLSRRTNHAGLKALAHLVLGHGYRVKAVPMRDCLHLKSAASYLGGDELLFSPAWVDLASFAGTRGIEIDPSEAHAANVLPVGDTILVPAAAPRTAERLEAAGRNIRLVANDELAKAEGALTCQSLLFAENNV